VSVKTEQFEDLGFVKYSGESLVKEVIDAGSAGSALVGLVEDDLLLQFPAISRFS
jgi:hypothetical protein